MGRYKVLIAEDAEDLASVMCRFLRTRSDAEIYHVNSGNEAIELMESEAFNLVITDLQMPRGNGLKVVDKAKELGLDIIVHSGVVKAYEYHLPEDVTLLEKPSRLQDLLDLINLFRSKAELKKSA